MLISNTSTHSKQATIVERIDAGHPLKIIPDDGPVTPLYCTGIGKILLASMTEPEIEEYFDKTDIKAHTPNTITDLNLLKKHLMMVSKDGFAYDDEELYPGVRNVASGIRDAEGKIVSCVSVLGPSVRLTRAKMTEIAPDVKRCAMEISKALGYRGTSE